MTYKQYGIGNLKTWTEDKDLKDREIYFQERVFSERNITETAGEVKWEYKITDKKILWTAEYRK